MAETIKGNVKNRYELSTTFTSGNPTLLAGEIGFESDTKKYKVGDGSTEWNNLKYSDNKVVYDTAANFVSNNPVLEAGIIGFESDSRKFKFGNGSSAWNTLLYASSTGVRWDATEGYVEGEIVTYDGETWIANANNNGKEPGVDPEWTKAGRLYWFDFKTYAIGDLVVYDEIVWQCLKVDTGTEPGTDNLVWRAYDPGSAIVGTGMTYYDTGWITPADWTNATETITHNLGADFEKLIIKGYMKCDEWKAQENLFYFNLLNSSNLQFACVPESTENINNFIIRFSQDGPIIMGDDGLADTVGSITNPQYRIVVYLPNDTDIIFPINQVTHKYDTGWFTPSDWTNAIHTIAHSLNEDFENLIIKGYTRSDENGIQESLFGATYFGNTTGCFSESTGDTNNFDIRFALGGPRQLDVSSGEYENLASQTNPEIRVVVYKPELLTENLTDTTIKYDTGWVANSDWTAFSATITHNLDAQLSNLLVKFLYSPTGNDSDAVEVQTAARVTSGDVAAGVSFGESTLNSFSLTTGTQGFYIITPSTGAIDLVDTESAYYRVVAYNPQVISDYLPIGNVTHKYDTGWIVPADWTDAITTIAHGLNAEPWELVIEGWLKNDNYGTQNCLFSQVVSGTAYGAVVKSTGDLNNFNVEFCPTGVLMQRPSDHQWYPVTDGAGGAMRIVVYKPEMITENVTPVQDVIMNDDTEYTITSNDTDTQVDATNCGPGKTLTLVQGTGASFGHRVTLNNHSANDITVTDGTSTYTCFAGEVRFFWFGGSTLYQSIDIIG